MFIAFDIDKTEVRELAENVYRIRYQKVRNWTMEFMEDVFLPNLKSDYMSGQRVNDKNGRLFRSIKPHVGMRDEGVFGFLRVNEVVGQLNAGSEIYAKDKLMTVPLTKRFKTYSRFLRYAEKNFAMKPLGESSRGREEYLAGVKTEDPRRIRPFFALKDMVHPTGSRGFLDDAIVDSQDDFYNFMSDKIKVYFHE